MLFSSHSHAQSKAGHSENVLTFAEFAPAYEPRPADREPGYEIVEENGRTMIRIGDVSYETKSFSGKVVDADGNPIAGATGTLYAPPMPSCTITTDENGEWTAGPYPVYTVLYPFRLEHPDFVTFHWNASRDDHSVIKLDRGARISGTITDETGQPLENVDVFIRGSTAQIETTVQTDSKGHYTLHALPLGHSYFVVPKAEGKAFTGEYVTMEREDKVVDLTLQPGRTITIRFVTEDGKPFTDAWAVPFQWKGLTSSDDFAHLQNYVIRDYAKGFEMGEDGVWTWHDAPLCEMRFRVGWKYNARLVHFLDDKKVYIPDTGDIGAFGHEMGSLLVPPETSEFTVKMIASDPPPLREWERDEHIYMPEKLDYTLVDQHGKPVVGATIKATIGLIDLNNLNSWDPFRKRYEGTIQTDAAGKCVVDFSSFKQNQIILFSMKIDAGKDYLPVQVFWRDDSLGRMGHGPYDLVKKVNHVPEQWTMVVPCKDTLISGTVVDEQGNPLPGVLVRFFAPLNIDYPGTLTPYPTGPNIPVATDDEGKWSVKYYSMEGYSYRVECSHPGYLKGGSFGNITETIVMKKAGTLTVRVKDENGHPVYGAWVSPESSSYGDHAKQGEYVANVNYPLGRDVEIVVLTQNHTPVRVVHEMKSDNEVVEVTLMKGKPLRLRAVYPDGKPVTGFTNIHLTLTWPEAKGKPLRNGTYFSFDTDGVFVWPNAPDIEADYKIDFGSGYFPLRTQEKTYRMRPREEEYVITVLPRK